MTTQPLIIVLEDDYERTNWLRRTIIGVEILEYSSVKQFVAAVEEHKERVSMLIFDHDLGYPTPGEAFDFTRPCDPDGLNGLHAAQMVSEVNCPALVWSNNTYGRQRICAEMTKKSTVVYDARYDYSTRMKIAETILTHCKK